MADGDTFLIPTDPENPFPLGRAGVHHDPRNKLYRALATPPARSPTPFPRWYCRTIFDQGDRPRCTAEAAVGLLHTQPYTVQTRADRPAYDEPHEREQLYLEAQRHDPWPGEDYDGSSTDAPFRVLRDRGVITGWRWLFGEEELWEYVQWHGPAVVGTIWLSGMFRPRPDGFLDVTGAEVGGHAYKIRYADPKRQAYRKDGSWSRGWGDDGRAWISRTDMAGLLARQGEAVVIA